MDIGVLTVVTALLAAASVHALWKWAQERDDINSRGPRALWAGVVIVLTLVAGFYEYGHHQRQDLATRAMSAVTDNPRAHANCERLTESFFNLSQFDGFVYYADTDVAHYKRKSCRDLAAYASSSHFNPSLEQVAAVHLIAHEVAHINGYWVEAEAECWAVQNNHLVAQELGATPEQARALQARYFTEIYPLTRSDYRSGKCTAGGEFDANPDRAEFP